MALLCPDEVAAVDHQLNSTSCVINFCAEWCEPCAHMNAVFAELANEFTSLSYIQVDADRLPELCERFELDSVPAFLFFHGGALVDKLLGADASSLTLKVKAHNLTASLHTKTMETIPAPVSTDASSQGTLEERLKVLINSSPVMVFIKGTPDAPRCGFSRQICEVLTEAKIQFGHFDILTDEKVRQGLKTFSNWPTYPQLYAEGKLVGGLDIVKELKEEGELLDALPVSVHS